MAVEVEVLGPVRLLVDQQPVDAGGPRPRALLAVLALAGGRAVSDEDLAAGVWPEDPPATAPATLRAYVSRLRRLVGDAIRRDPAGYALDAVVDADRFRAALTAAQDLADPRARADALDAALAMWRGPALGGAGGSDPLRRAAERLEDLRVDARRAGAVAASAAGRHDVAIAELRALVAEHPTREPLVGDLMVALYRAGRQQDALAAFTDVRTALAESSGLEPGPALRDVHRRVLAHDAALLRDADAPPPPAPASAPAAAEPPDHAPQPPQAPTAGMSARTSNLPLPLTTFVGREDELAALAAQVDTHRLITLTGPGGTGKTRLALEACRRRDDADGPWLVELAAVEDQAFVATAVAEALRIGVPDGRPAIEVVAAALAQRSTVLLVDNCEHVVEGAAAVVDRLLSSCPDVRVVATSREPLGVPGERIFAVPTLPVVRRTPELIVADGDAMRLFLDRARNVVPDLVADPPTLELVRRICDDLDGLPLAIELAAAELRTLSPRQLEEQLADRFVLLTGGPRTVMPRQRTLQTTVAWSVDLLDDAQRALFAELSVFAGGFELDAVRAVCGPHAAVRLGDLVERSLVEVDTGREPRRYRMLETLRQYGAGLLDDGAAADLHERHARWCAGLVAEAAGRLRTADGPVWERRLDRETANVRVGLRTLLDRGDRRRALETAEGLWWYWFRRARLEEGRRWLAEAVAGDHEPDGVLASAHYGLAFLAFFAGDPAVEVHNDDAIAIARAAGDRVQLARVLTSKGYRWALFGRGAEARPLVAEGLEVLDDDTPAWVAAECWFAAGQAARNRGEREVGRERLERALDLARCCGHRWVHTVSLWVLAEHALDVDDPQQAARLLAQAVELARADGDRAAVLGSLRSLAGVAARLGRPTDGATLLGMVAGLAERVGMDVDHMERTDAVRTTEVLRAALRPEAFEAAVRAGRDQPIGAALALARDLLGDVPQA